MANYEKTLNIYTTSGATAGIGDDFAPSELEDMWKSCLADIHLEQMNLDDDEDNDFPTPENYIGGISYETFCIDTLEDFLNGHPLDTNYLLNDFAIGQHVLTTIELLLNRETRDKLSKHFEMKDINRIVTINNISFNDQNNDRELSMQAIELFMRLTGTSRTLIMICPSNPASVASYDQSNDLESYFKENGFDSLEGITGQKVLHENSSEWEVLFKPALKLNTK